MAALQWLLVLLTVMSSVYSQDLTLSGAEVFILNNPPLNSPYPVRFYNGFQRTGDTTTIGRGLVDLDTCLRECVNANGAVLPAGTPSCNAIDFLTVVPPTATDNCFTHFDAGCSIATTNYFTPPAGTTAVHYKIVHLCDDIRLILRPEPVTIDTNQLPTGVTVAAVPTQTTAASCGLLCEVTGCIAAEFTTFAGCRHFRTATPMLGQCLQTINSVGATSYVLPCFTPGRTEGIKQGLVPGSVARTATTQSFFQCEALCLQDPECIGFQYNTIAEFLGPITARCALYDKYDVVESIACRTATQTTNFFTLLKFPCRYNQLSNMRKVGGILQSQWRTLYECERECNENRMCVAFDWNKDPSTRDRDRCWFHTEYRGGCEAPRDTTMVDHYELINSRCSINADEYYIFLGVQLSGTGMTQASATTYTLCLAACNNAQACEGFDFITGTNTCITHMASTVCSTFTPTAAATHYRKRRYDCYWRYRNSQVSGGVPQAGVTILGNCERICRQTVGCEGFDFDRTGFVPNTPCFLHLTGTVCNRVSRATDIEHYRVRTRVCNIDNNRELGVIALANWANAMQNVHTIGNMRNGREESAIECLWTCQRLGNRVCSGIDYDRRTGFCYIVSRSNACAATPSILNHVDRIRLATGCDAPQVAGYTGTGSQHRLGGELRDSNSNPTECKSICDADPLCGSFDFDRTNNECWTHTRTQECRNEMITFNNACCDRYVNSTLNCGTFNAPTLTNLNVVLRDMLHVPGGVAVPEQQNIVTERLCVQHCNGRSDCTSVDFNFRFNRCYVHTPDTSCNSENTHMFVHRYVKNGNCGFP